MCAWKGKFLQARTEGREHYNQYMSDGKAFGSVEDI